MNPDTPDSNVTVPTNGEEGQNTPMDHLTVPVNGPENLAELPELPPRAAHVLTRGAASAVFDETSDLATSRGCNMFTAEQMRAYALKAVLDYRIRLLDWAERKGWDMRSDSCFEDSIAAVMQEMDAAIRKG
jgi:hypothetical protein